MKHPLLLLVFFSIGATSCVAQQTPVSATVVDPVGIPYNFASGYASIACPGNQQPTFNGSPLTRTITITGFDGNGHFSMVLWDVGTIQPVGCGWQFMITWKDNLTSFTTGIIGKIGQTPAITGQANVDLSAAISAFSVPLPTSGGGVAPGTVPNLAYYATPTTLGSTVFTYKSADTSGGICAITVLTSCADITSAADSAINATSADGFMFATLYGLSDPVGGANARFFDAIAINGFVQSHHYPTVIGSNVFTFPGSTTAPNGGNCFMSGNSSPPCGIGYMSVFGDHSPGPGGGQDIVAFDAFPVFRNVATNNVAAFAALTPEGCIDFNSLPCPAPTSHPVNYWGLELQDMKGVATSATIGVHVEPQTNPASGNFAIKVEPGGGPSAVQALSAVSVNGTQYADQFAGATADVKINACIAAVASGGGTCDATGLFGTQTIAAEVDVGTSNTKFVNLRLPCGAVWNVTISNGTSSALKVFGGSSITSNCAQNQSTQIKLANAGNVASLLTNDQTCGSCSVKVQGLMLYNTLGGTVANAMMDISNIGNNAEFTGINVASFKTKGLWIHGANSESTFTAINVDGSQTTGNVPCTFETTSGSLETMRFFGLDCQHPGAGNKVMVMDGHGAANLCCLSFYSSHMEGSNTDTTTPFVSIADANNISFYSPLFNSLDAGTTNWGLSISQTGAGLTDGILMANAKHGNGNYVNDTINSKTYSGNGDMLFYTFVKSGSTVFSTVTTTLAAGTVAMPTGAIGGGSCSAATAATVTGGTAALLLTTDTVAFSVSGGLPGINPGELVVWATIPSNGSAPSFEYCNETGGSVTPNATTLNWRVVR